LPEYGYDDYGQLRRRAQTPDIPQESVEDRSVRIEVRFNQAVPHSPYSLGYGVEYRTHNAFATSRWEAINLHRAAREWTAVTVRAPCRELWFRVRLGAGIYARNPFLQCDFSPEYPSLKLDPSGYLTDKPHARADDPARAATGEAGRPEAEARTKDTPKDERIPDGETTAHERAFLRSEGPNAWVLQVP